MSLYAILQFRSPFDQSISSSKVVFCSSECCQAFKQELESLHANGRGSWVHRGVADVRNKSNQCGECEESLKEKKR